MTRYPLRIFALLSALLLLTACAQKSPQEVADAFWTAVINNDAKDAVKYSTLTDVREYDGFSQDWSGFSPSWGKIVIEGDNATIATTLTKSTGSGDKSVSFDTLLIRQDEQWKVDYARTAKQVSGGPFAKLFGQLERVGKSISAQFSATSEQLSAEMEQMGEQLAKLSQSLGDQATEIVEQQGEALRKKLKELAESTRRALKEHERSLSDNDRQVLREVADDLEQQSDNLAEPNLNAIADGGRSVAAANQKVGAINNDALGEYQEQWQEWSEKIEKDMQKFLEEVSAMAKQ